MRFLQFDYLTPSGVAKITFNPFALGNVKRCIKYNARHPCYGLQRGAPVSMPRQLVESFCNASKMTAAIQVSGVRAIGMPSRPCGSAQHAHRSIACNALLRRLRSRDRRLDGRLRA
jgi:hypothetical protein